MLANKYFYKFKKHKVFSCIFTDNDVKLLKTFASNRTIVVCKLDKGRGVVIIDKAEYIEKVTEIVSATTKFSKITIPVEKWIYPQNRGHSEYFFKIY